MPGLHLHRMEYAPNGRDPSAGADDRKCFAWATFNSRTTLDDPSSDRSIVWAPGHLYAEARHVCMSFYWKPEKGDKPGRLFNGHTHPRYGGWTQPENPDGVSPFAIDYFGGQVYPDGASGLVYVCQAHARSGKPYHYTIFTPAEVERARQEGRALSFTVEWDIRDTYSGNVQISANGRYVHNLTGIRTVFPGMTGIGYWEGEYNSSGVSEHQSNVYGPTRIGRSRAECLADGTEWPIVEAALWGQVDRDTGAETWKHTPLGELPTSAYIVPSDWGGVVPEPPPVLEGDFDWTPASPVPGQAVTFSVKTPEAGVSYAWDRTLDGLADGQGATYEYAYQGAGDKTVALYANGQEVARHTLKVLAVPPPNPLGLHVTAQTSTTVTLKWTPPATQQGYVPTIDGSDLLTDGKRHASVSKSASSVKIGKPRDGKPHTYGVSILGATLAAEVSV